MTTTPPATTLHLQLDRTTAVTASPHVLAVAGMFGLGIDQARTVTIVPPVMTMVFGIKLSFRAGGAPGRLRCPRW